MNGYGYQGQHAGDPWNRNSSTISKMEHTFWVTKQSVFRKLGKKEDECIVASDAELDAKLELFRSVQDTCLDLQKILDRYQDRLCNLAQEESAMGRFLRDASKRDQTNAGKAMTAVGKSLAYSGQQRMCLRVPLQRLYQEVETFRLRAIEDTLINVTAMEKQRTEYRAALSWMKNISQELDPDTDKQLEKFRKVQGQVRLSKTRFDKLKLDCLQKVDLLAAARCNMFSHALTLYQTALLQHVRRAHRAYVTVGKQIQGYQHYEFSVVPELTVESSRLAKQSREAVNSPDEGEDVDKDDLLFFDTEYHDKEESIQRGETAAETRKSDSLQNLLSSGEQTTSSLISIESESTIESKLISTGMKEIDLLASDCFNQMDDLLSKPVVDLTTNDASDDWASFFGDGGSSLDNPAASAQELLGEAISAPLPNASDKSNESVFLPSQLLNQFTSLNLNSSDAPTLQSDTTTDNKLKSSPFPMGSMGFMSNFMSNLKTNSPHSQFASPSTNTLENVSQSGKATNENKKDLSPWFDLFADLDPLSNPDALGSVQSEEERNC